MAAKVAQLTEEWGEVRASLVEVEAPAEVQTSADEIARTLAARRGTILAQQGRVLALQERVSRSLQRTAEADAEIAQWLRGRLENVLRTDTMPLWRQPILRDRAAAVDHLTRAVQEFARPLRPYVETRSANVVVHLLLVLVLAALLRVARGVVSEWPQRTPEVAEFLAVAQRPLAAAVMVGTIAGFWAHAECAADPLGAGVLRGHTGHPAARRPSHRGATGLSPLRADGVCHGGDASRPGGE